MARGNMHLLSIDPHPRLPPHKHTPSFPCIDDWTAWADRWWVTFVCPISLNMTQVAHFHFRVWFSFHSRGLLWLCGKQIKQRGGFDLKGWGSTFQRNEGCVRAGWNGWCETTRVMCGKESQHVWKERWGKHLWKWACAILCSSETVVPSQRRYYPAVGWRVGWKNQFAVATPNKTSSPVS